MIIQEALLNILPYVADPEDTAAAAAKGMRFGDVYRQLSARVDGLPTRRSVRRIMDAMSDYIDHVGNTNAARWFKVRDTVMLGCQWRMNVNTAIALTTLERMATHHLPGAVFAGLAPRFAEARATLELNGSEHAQKGKTWDAKIMRIASARPLIPPPIDDAIYNSVTDALMRDRLIDLRYEPKKPDGKVSTYPKLSPLGLLDDASVFYLVAQSKDGTRLFRLDRMNAVKVRDDSSAAIPGFDLKAFVASSGLAGFKSEPEVVLKLRVHAREGQYGRTVAEHALTQFSLHESQRIVEWAEDGKSFVVTATVRPSVSLRNFLHSQSDTIEVLAPASMRAEFAERVRLMAERYAQQHND
ncbi:helix-turn-helix transcriptional regulator [Paraburkholderia sediminicola]|uniref:helix-turn-helix transcriptional regulator n=1 Tax=Paraburkholderia sediminicola TaxID=458836 RepID=UPI0038BCDFC6